MGLGVVSRDMEYIKSAKSGAEGSISIELTMDELLLLKIATVEKSRRIKQPVLSTLYLRLSDELELIRRVVEGVKGFKDCPECGSSVVVEDDFFSFLECLQCDNNWIG